MTTIVFLLVTETKGALRYQEHSAEGIVREGDDAKIGTLYFRKAHMGELSAQYASEGTPPTRVRLTVDCD